MGFKKKLYQWRPREQEQEGEIQITKDQKRTVSVNPGAVEREVRQMLAEKISGTYVGLGLLVPEHLRLGTWELVTSWRGMRNANAIEPRLA